MRKDRKPFEHIKGKTGFSLRAFGKLHGEGFLIGGRTVLKGATKKGEEEREVLVGGDSCGGLLIKRKPLLEDAVLTRDFVVVFGGEVATAVLLKVGGNGVIKRAPALGPFGAAHFFHQLFDRHSFHPYEFKEIRSVEEYTYPRSYLSLPR